jgi:hypothetical protein
MHTIFRTTKFHQKAGAYIFNIGILAGVATLAFGLTSCGGGGAGGNATSGSTAPTIDTLTTGISNGVLYKGVVASSVTRAITIRGSNFNSTMTLSIKDSSGNTAGTISASSVINAQTLAVSAVISTAPSDRYVVVEIKSATGTATEVLGVASTNLILADVLPIFTSTTTICSTCHGGNGGLTLPISTTDMNIPLLYDYGVACNSIHRVKPGDPRRGSSLLIDKITIGGTRSCNSGTSMPPPGHTISASEVQAVVDWVAGGARIQ